VTRTLQNIGSEKPKVVPHTVDPTVGSKCAKGLEAKLGFKSTKHQFSMRKVSQLWLFFCITLNILRKEKQLHPPTPDALLTTANLGDGSPLVEEGMNLPL
jgi:hypothetical protein